MSDLILGFLYTVLFLPLWSFLIIMGGRFFSVYINKNIINILTLFSSFLGVVFCLVSLTKLAYPIEQSIPFIKINDFIINIGVHLDKLSLIIGLVLFLVSFSVQIFSLSFMRTDKKSYRYYALLNLFNFSMFGLLVSPNLFQIYAFWELVGVISYLLIGFEYDKKEKSIASLRVILTNRIGDTALISAIIMTSYFMYNYASNLSFVTLSFEDIYAISTLLYAYTSTPHFYLIAGLFLVGALVKSAQFPFYTWLQDAMEAKLPISALLHSATMVIAGVYLTIRLLPIYSMDQNLMNIITGAGIITAVICSLLACFEVHPKKVLAYSTSANIGLMFFAVGIWNIKAAVVFLISHAFIKAMLFLALPQNKENISYANFIIFMLGALSLSGIAFSGLVAKEFLFTSLEHNVFFASLYCVVSFFTAFYIIRLSLLITEGRVITKSFNKIEILSAVSLLVLNICFYLFVRTKLDYRVSEPIWCAILAWGVVYFLYLKALLKKFSPKVKILENLYYKNFPDLYSKFTIFLKYVDEKIFANYKPLIFCAKTNIRFVNWIETAIMNKTVQNTVDFIKNISQVDKRMQTKNVQIYNAYAFIIITVIICLIIFGYVFVINQMT